MRILLVVMTLLTILGNCAPKEKIEIAGQGSFVNLSGSFNADDEWIKLGEITCVFLPCIPESIRWDTEVKFSNLTRELSIMPEVGDRLILTAPHIVTTSAGISELGRIATSGPVVITTEKVLRVYIQKGDVIYLDKYYVLIKMPPRGAR